MFDRGRKTRTINLRRDRKYASEPLQYSAPLAHDLTRPRAVDPCRQPSVICLPTWSQFSGFLTFFQAILSTTPLSIPQIQSSLLSLRMSVQLNRTPAGWPRGIFAARRHGPTKAPTSSKSFFMVCCNSTTRTFRNHFFKIRGSSGCMKLENFGSVSGGTVS